MNDRSNLCRFYTEKEWKIINLGQWPTRRHHALKKKGHSNVEYKKLKKEKKRTRKYKNDPRAYYSRNPRKKGKKRNLTTRKPTSRVTTLVVRNDTHTKVPVRRISCTHTHARTSRQTDRDRRETHTKWAWIYYYFYK